MRPSARLLACDSYTDVIETSDMAEDDTITEGRCVEYTAFWANYDRLSYAIPVQPLLPTFVAKKVINYLQEEFVLAGETDLEKRRRLLKHIADPLECNTTSSFYTFLKILENCGVEQTAWLATEIRQSLSTEESESQKLMRNDSGKNIATHILP